MTQHKLVLRAEQIRDQLNEEIQIRTGKLADQRLAICVREFKKRFPKRSLRVLFGNGSEFIAIDGRTLNVNDRDNWTLDFIRGSLGTKRYGAFREVPALQFIADAIQDVRDICDDYRGCGPNEDIEIGPPPPSAQKPAAAKFDESRRFTGRTYLRWKDQPNGPRDTSQVECVCGRFWRDHEATHGYCPAPTPTKERP